MGRAIVRDTAAFLFDEPLSNLDAALRVQVREEIIALHRQIPATMICVTHDQAEAMTLADRIVVLSDGEVQQIGTPHEIYNTPQSRFVAEFIGSQKTNVLPAKATATVSHGEYLGATKHVYADVSLFADSKPCGSLSPAHRRCRFRPRRP